MSQLYDMLLTSNDCNINDTTKYSLLDICCCRYFCRTIGSYREDYEILEECKREVIARINIRKYGMDGPYQLHIALEEKKRQKIIEAEERKTKEQQEFEEQEQLKQEEQDLKDNEDADSNDNGNEDENEDEDELSEISANIVSPVDRKKHLTIKPIYMNFDEYLDICQEKIDKIFLDKIQNNLFSKTTVKYIKRYFDSKIKGQIKQYFQSYYSVGSDVSTKYSFEILFNEYFNISYSDLINSSIKHIFKRDDSKTFTFNCKKFIEYNGTTNEGRCSFCPHLIDSLKMRNLECIVLNTLSQSLSNENKSNILINLLYLVIMTRDRWKFYIQLPSLPEYDVLDHKIREKRVCAKFCWVLFVLFVIITMLIGGLVIVINTVKN